MKNLKLFTLLAVFTFAFTIGNAQSVAHVNSDEILKSMPDYAAAQTKLENEAKRHKTEIERQQAEIQKIYENAMKEMKAAQGKSEAEQKAVAEKLRPIEEDLQAKQKAMTEYQNTATKKLGEMENSLITPIHNQIKEAIKAVGDAKKIGYIIDVATAAPSGLLLYFDGGKDLTNDVKAKLGL